MKLYKNDSKLILVLALGVLSLIILVVLLGKTNQPSLQLLLLALIYLNMWSFPLLYFMRFVEPFNLKTTRLSFVSKVNARIVFISDAQLAGYYPEYLSKIINQVNSLRADVILWGGDLVEATAQELELYAELKNLNSKLGNFAILGNHDYYLNCKDYNPEIKQNVIDFWQSNNFTVLQNSCSVIQIKNRKLQILGLQSFWFNKHNWNELINSKLSADFNILLAHEPELLNQIPTGFKVDLALSGHTHGRQVGIPLLSWRKGFVVGKNYGLHKFGKILGYVTSGIGFGTAVLRLFSQPEIVVIDLKSE